MGRLSESNLQGRYYKASELWEYAAFDYTRHQSRLTRHERKLGSTSTPYSYVASSTRYEYDQFALTNRSGTVQHDPSFTTGFTNRGNVTTVKQFLASENRYLSTTTRYDILGNVLQVTDPGGRTTTTQYSTAFQYAYPTMVTNPAGHQSATDYDWETGLVLSATDPNGRTSEWAYDAYNRMIRRDLPDGGWKAWAYFDTWNSGKYRMKVAPVGSHRSPRPAREVGVRGTAVNDGLRVGPR